MLVQNGNSVFSLNRSYSQMQLPSFVTEKYFILNTTAQLHSTGYASMVLTPEKDLHTTKEQKRICFENQVLART